MRRREEAYRRISAVTLPPSLLPSFRLSSVCRHKDAEMKLPVVSCALIQVRLPTPPSSPPFLCPVIHSWSTHTHSHTCRHTHILQNSHHKKREAETTAT